MNRRLLALLLAALATIAMVGCSFGKDTNTDDPDSESEATVTDSPSNHFEFEENDDGDGVIILEYTGSSASVVIPNKLGGKKVLALGARVFEGSEKVKNITLPASLEEIDTQAFVGCAKLEKFAIKSGNEFFKVTAGNLYSSSGATLVAYAPANSKTSFVVPKNTATIESYAFADAINLERVEIPDSVLAINANAFKGCDLIVYAMGDEAGPGWSADAFGGNPVLFGQEPGSTAQPGEATPTPATSTTPDAGNGTPAPLTSGDFTYEIEGSEITIVGYSGTSGNVVFPAEIAGKPVTFIEDSVFSGRAYSILSVTLPATVQAIDNLTFDNCESLISFTVLGGSYFSVRDGDLYNGDGTKIVRYCSGKTATSFTVPAGVKVIGNSAFDSSQNLKTIIIPTSVTTIENFAFYDCDALTSVFIPASVTEVGISVFVSCTPDILTVSVEVASRPDNWKDTWDKEVEDCVIWGATAA